MYIPKSNDYGENLFEGGELIPTTEVVEKISKTPKEQEMERNKKIIYGQISSYLGLDSKRNL